MEVLGFPSGLMVKNPPVNTGDASSIPGSGRTPAKGNGNPLHYSCLEIPWTEPGGPCPWDRKRVRHDLAAKQQHNMEVLVIGCN